MSEFDEVGNLVKKVINLKQKKEYRRARQLLLEALEEYPGNNFLKTSLADLNTRMNRLPEAEKLAQQVLVAEPENHNALTVKGNIAFQKRNYGQALQFFKQAYRVKQSDYLGSRIVRTYIRLGEFESALGFCRQKLEEAPENTQFKKLEAEIYKKMDEFEKAVSLMEDYISDEEDDQFAIKEMIELKLKDKSAEAAVRELRQLLKVEKYRNNIHLQTLLAEKLQKVGKYEQAAEVYKEALTLDPGSAFVIKNLGMCLYNNGQLEQALPYLEGAFREDPNDYYVRSTLEYIYKKLNMHQQGIDFFQKIIKETGLNKLWGTIKKLAKGVEKDEQDRGSDRGSSGEDSNSDG